MAGFERNIDIVRAANMIILRKLRDKMKINREIFEREMEIKKSSMDNIVKRDPKAAINWKYKAVAVAEKMKMDPDVFEGKRLIHIGSSITNEALNYFDEIFEEFIKKNPKYKNTDKQEVKKAISDDEYNLWCVLFTDLDNRKSDENLDDYESLQDNIGQQSKISILADVARQVDEESFNDDQLWKFWNYFRKLK